MKLRRNGLTHQTMLNGISISIMSYYKRNKTSSATAVTLAPLPGGTSTGTYTAAPTSDLTLILGGLVPATVGQVFTVSLA